MSIQSVLVIIVAVVLFVFGGIALATQDKYAVQVPGGLSLSECRGYEEWPAVAVSHPEDKINMIVANQVMIEAYLAGVPGNGKPFPDGAKTVKIHWKPKQSTEAPFPVAVPDTMIGLGCMVKDSKRFADGGGWGYAQFDYHLHAQYIFTGQRCQVRGRVPYDSQGKGLRFHGIPETVRGIIITVGFRRGSLHRSVFHPLGRAPQT